MIEFWNVVVATICAFILGMAVHSGYAHSRKRKEIKKVTPLEEG